MQHVMPSSIWELGDANLESAMAAFPKMLLLPRGCCRSGLANTLNANDYVFDFVGKRSSGQKLLRV